VTLLTQNLDNRPPHSPVPVPVLHRFRCGERESEFLSEEPNKTSSATTKPTMKTKFISTIAIVTALFAGSAVAQSEQHFEADKAIAKIVLQKDYGEQLKFASREFVTMTKNYRVPGLNGLMFMRWTGTEPGTRVDAQVLWFEKTLDLLRFYASETKREDHKLGEFNGTRIWKMSQDRTEGYLWTDGKHFMVSLGGSPHPPEEMVKDLLAMIGSKVAEIEKRRQEIEKRRENEQAPREPAKE